MWILHCRRSFKLLANFVLESSLLGFFRGIGPKNAIKLVQEHKTIEEILKHVDTKKNTVPENWQYAEARRLFTEPEVTKGDQVSARV